MPDGGGLIRSTWYFSGDGEFHSLGCAGQIDFGEWLSIAETFEYLPVDDES